METAEKPIAHNAEDGDKKTAAASEGANVEKTEAANIASAAGEEHEEGGEEGGEVAPSQDVHFEPVMKLEQVETKTMEEDEDVFFKTRAKMFRFDDNQWKERGTGDLKMLQHRESRKVRIVMRRDKTLKVCANHRIVADMKLTPNVGSDRSWVYTAYNDVGEDGVAKTELLAVRFANAEIAQEFKEKFFAAQRINSDTSDDAVAEKKDADKSAEPSASAAAEEKAAVKEDQEKAE